MISMSKSRNKESLKSFIEYCALHPDERFWQALRNWSGWPFIVVSEHPPIQEGQDDTFYWEENVAYDHDDFEDNG